MLTHIHFKEHNGHFIKNTVTIPPKGEFLLIQDYERFEKYFGVAAIMGDQQSVTPDLFATHNVLAVLKDYLCISHAHSVMIDGAKMVFIYDEEKFEATSWTGHSCLIISIPKSYIGFPHCTDFMFVNLEGYLAINAVDKANASNADTYCAGCPTAYHLAEEDEKKIFAAGMEGLLGVQYVPVLCRTQVVNGTQYDFICLSRVIYPGAAWSLSQVLLIQTSDGRILRKSIRRVRTLDNIDNAGELIAAAEEAAE